MTAAETATVARRPYDIAIAIATVGGGLALWSGTDGGYEEIVWYPVGLVLLVLACVLAWAVGQRSLDRLSVVALGGFASYVCFAFLSIAWAPDRGLALTGANRSLVYLLIFVVVLLRRWRGADATVLATGWAVATVVIGYVALVEAGHASSLGSRFLEGRLITPIDYANANAALFAIAAWPFVGVFLERRAHPALRGLAVGGAAAASGLSLLCQSKGAALGTASAVVVVAVAARRRAQILLVILLVAVSVLVFSGPLLDVYHRLNAGGDGKAAVRSAATALAGAFALAALLGGLAAAAGDRLLRDHPARAAFAGRVFVAALAAAALVGAAGVAAHYGGPVQTVQRAWHAFAHPSGGDDTSSHFLTAAGNYRYDYWRVAFHQFERSPVGGDGIDNFGAEYVRDRRTTEEPLYPHSIELRLLGGTGIVGFLLFAVFVAAAATIVIRAARSRTGLVPVGVAGLGGLTYWLAHGSVDWLWEFPALTGPVVAFVACAASCAAAPPWRRRVVLPARLLGAAAAIGAVVLLAPAWLSARDVALAVSTWRHQPSHARSLLDSAARLNGLSDEPYLVAGTIAERERNWPVAEDRFRRALARNPGNWYAHLELGIALAQRHERAGALVELRRASALNPRETLVDGVLTAVRRGLPVDTAALDRRFIARTTVHSAR